MKSLSKKRIEDVFNKTLENMRNGQPANVSGTMRDFGYSPNSAKALTITQTQTWQQLLATIDDNQLLGRLNNIALDPQDKRSSLQAIDMLLKLKDKYPAGKLKVTAQNEARAQFVEE